MEEGQPALRGKARAQSIVHRSAEAACNGTGERRR